MPPKEAQSNIIILALPPAARTYFNDQKNINIHLSPKSLKAITLADFPGYTKEQAFCIILGIYPQIPANELLDSAKQLGLKPRGIAHCAIAMNHFTLLNSVRDTMTPHHSKNSCGWFCSRSNKKDPFTEVLEQIDPEAIDMAVENGNLELLKWQRTRAPNIVFTAIENDDYHLFRVAASLGHKNILQWFQKEVPNHFNNMISADHYRAFRWAAENDQLEVVQWLTEQVEAQEFFSMVGSCNYYALSMSEKCPGQRVYNWLSTILPQSDCPDESTQASQDSPDNALSKLESEFEISTTSDSEITAKKPSPQTQFFTFKADGALTPTTQEEECRLN